MYSVHITWQKSASLPPSACEGQNPLPQDEQGTSILVLCHNTHIASNKCEIPVQPVAGNLKEFQYCAQEMRAAGSSIVVWQKGLGHLL